MFLGFKGEHLNNGSTRRTYEDSTVFLIGYLVLSFVSVLDIWAYCDDVLRGGVILEPHVEPELDLSGLTFNDGCFFCVALPMGAAIQFIDFIAASFRYCINCFAGGRRTFVVHKTKSNGDVVQTNVSRKSSGICFRIFKTIGRRCR
jgi:hypothetical protein